ncbi:MAG TPA: hypothetical protein VMU11_02955 [Verrucomicrobiae bacterium]|nr:hypothetical protein [Verrucomicrobiae bacterium]
MTYTTYRAEEAYLRRHADGRKNGVFVEAPSKDGNGTVPGLRWERGPFRFEGFYSDAEPVPDPFGPRRLVVWQPLRRDVKRAKGWWRFPLPVNVRRTGYAEITDPQFYWKNWNENVRRQRAKWLKQDILSIEPVSADEYIAAYREAKPWFHMRDLFVTAIRERLVQHRGLLHLFGARERATGKLRAGFAVLDVPEAGASIHLTSFYDFTFARTGVGTGLVDAWFRHAVAHGIRFLDFDIFWVKGEPREWKGFSTFKSQFGTKFVDYPLPLLAIVGGRRKR